VCLSQPGSLCSALPVTSGDNSADDAVQDPATDVAAAASCAWTYQLEVDETRSPLVLNVARCLDPSDRCETVCATITVQRLNSATGRMVQVSERFAVACRPKLTTTTTTTTTRTIETTATATGDAYRYEEYNNVDY